MDREELLWRQYSLCVELFKHYLKLTIEFNVFFYAITGAVVSYFFAHSTEPFMRHALLFPAAMSVVFAVFFLYAARLVEPLRSEVFAIQQALKLQVAPELSILAHVLRLFSGLLFLVGGGLFILWCRSAA